MTHTSDSFENCGYSPAAAADELAESFINGNRKYVRDAILSMRPARAAAVAAYLRDYLDGDSYEIGSFLRMLADAC